MSINPFYLKKNHILKELLGVIEKAFNWESGDLDSGPMLSLRGRVTQF